MLLLCVVDIVVVCVVECVVGVEEGCSHIETHHAMLSALLGASSRRGVSPPCVSYTPRVAELFFIIGINFSDRVPNYFSWPILPIMCYDGPDDENKRDAIRLALLRLGGEVEAADHGWKPIVAAAYNKHAGIATLLIDEFGADVDATTDVGFGALHYAVSKDCAELTETLLQRGAVISEGMHSRYASKKDQSNSELILLRYAALRRREERGGLPTAQPVRADPA